VRLEGDIVSALTWAEKGMARGEKAHNASMVFSLAAARWGLLVPFETFGFVPGKDNFLSDALSRDIAIADLGIQGLIRLRSLTLVNVTQDIRVLQTIH
jgi:hypothetical protein